MKVCSFLLSMYSSVTELPCNLSAKRVFLDLELPFLGILNKEVQGNRALLTLLFEKSEGFDALVVGHVDSDFYLLGENRKLLENFLRYHADFAYGDNHPPGIVFEIVRREALPVLENIRVQNNIQETRELFRELIAVDFNTFDLENLYAESDLRAFRLSFFAGDVQNDFIIARVKEKLKEERHIFSDADIYNISFSTLSELIFSHRDLLRVPPKHYSILLTNISEVENLFMPPGRFCERQGEMGVHDYEKILSRIISFSKNPIITFGNGAGMLFSTMHSEWERIIELTLASGVECILETSGVNFNESTLERLKGFANLEKLKIIFQIPALEKALYEKFYKAGVSFEKTMEIIEFFLLRFRENTYVETVKTTENYQSLPQFYTHFKNFTQNVLIAKYNPYRNSLQERRYNPMRPLEAIDCWHLKRNWLVDHRGDVWFCKQDINLEGVSGNLLVMSAEEVFIQGQIEYEKYLEGRKAGFCQDCDEYYTYTF